MFKRSNSNPILEKNPNNAWESYAVFNGDVVKRGENDYVMLYRAMGDEVIVGGRKLRLSVIGQAESTDGVNFKNRKIFIEPTGVWDAFGCEDPRVTFIDGKYYIFYTSVANWPPSAPGIHVSVAISKDLKTIEERHLVTPFNGKAMFLFPEKIDGKYMAFLTADSDKPPSKIGVAKFENIETLWDQDFWNDWYRNIANHKINLQRVNTDHVELGAVPVKTDEGWVLIYSYIKHYLNESLPNGFRIEALLLDSNDPTKIIGRVRKALLKPKEPYEVNGQIENIVFPEGAMIKDDKFRVYYGAADSYCAMAEADLDEFMKSFDKHKPKTLKCEKFPYNPILKAKPDHPWESKAVFNPAAIMIDDITYIVYRTTSYDDQSELGLAVSRDGYHIDERLKNPIYPLRSKYELPHAPGAWGGAEDPRLTRIGNRIYILYTAYDGILPRLSMSSISVKNFLERRWNTWAFPKIISPPNVADKDGVLFPEKIDGKYVFIHRIEPNIIIDTVDDLEFKNGAFLGSVGVIEPKKGTWDDVKIGVNGPPVKTKDGWIVFYHGISHLDKHYRLGAILIDLHDVTKVLGRTEYPILEPEEIFERKGVVDNVVFPCGQVVKDGKIILYYGGADEVVCGASIDIEDLLTYLK